MADARKSMPEWVYVVRVLGVAKTQDPKGSATECHSIRDGGGKPLGSRRDNYGLNLSCAKICGLFLEHGQLLGGINGAALRCRPYCVWLDWNAYGEFL